LPIEADSSSTAEAAVPASRMVSSAAFAAIKERFSDCSAITFMALANFSSSTAAWEAMPTTLRTSRSKVSTSLAKASRLSASARALSAVRCCSRRLRAIPFSRKTATERAMTPTSSRRASPSISIAKSPLARFVMTRASRRSGRASE
jgi:hypothetical protein